MIAAAPVADDDVRLVLMWAIGVGVLLLFAMWLHSRLYRRASEPVSASQGSLLQQAQAWQQSAGVGTTEFPAPHAHVADRGEGVAEWAPAGAGAKHAAPRRPGVLARLAGLLAELTGWARVQTASRRPVDPPEEGDTERLPSPERDVDRIFAQHAYRAQGAAAVPSPFDEWVRDRNDVLHGWVRAAANEEPTTVLPTVPPGGAR